MNVNVITRHSPSNYGSLLQTIATQKIVKDLGFECKIIDYIPKAETGIRIAFTQLKGKKKWNNNIIKKVVYILVREPENLIMYYKFSKMRRKYLTMTKRCSDLHELQSFFSNQDGIFMTGSDQVWGPISTGTYDPAYFLDFVLGDKKKVAFSSSFGKTEFTGECLSAYKTYLQRYSVIAVRENSAVEIISKMGLNVEQVLDPTLLVSAVEWEKFSTYPKTSNYVLVYQIHTNPALDKYAVEFAEKAKLPLIRVSAMMHQAIRGGKFVCLPDIGKFLSLIKNANYMITDSFHGTAFAINFNVQFIEVLPNTDTGSRNQSILKLTGLENRIAADLNDFHYINENIDYSYTNKILSEERKKSMKLLKDILD